MFDKDFVSNYRTSGELRWEEDEVYRRINGKYLSMLKPYSEWSNFETRLIAGNYTVDLAREDLRDSVSLLLPAGDLREQDYFLNARRVLGAFIKKAMLDGDWISQSAFPDICRKIMDTANFDEIAEAFLQEEAKEDPAVEATFAWNKQEEEKKGRNGLLGKLFGAK